ncbi:hypothetical protein BG011_005487 [Mortierella polycephala]|uniref:BRCT domain-containing protein n=1 Tax=Mortierella polycephala TaxID=41804 RepID=A0A9P6QEZ6_9FUNG|nr:hypothetical protein BG011_005487 [Mortierella polycephala]
MSASNKTSDSIATQSSGSTKGSARSNPSSSDLSYTNAQTSTPNATTTPRSTPSDSDRFSIPSQVSPSTRAGLRGGSQGSQGNSQVRGPSQSAGWNSSSGSGSGDSSGNLGVPTILEVDESTDILDQATLPIVGADYGTDVSQYDDEKSLGEGEKLPEQVLTAEVLAALNGNKGSSKRSGVQDVPQPSASTSKKRTAHRSSAVSVVTQDSNRPPASYSSDEDGEASRTSSGRVIKLEFTQSQSQADSSSLSRSRSAPGTAATSFSASTQTDNIPSTATLGSSVGTDPHHGSESSIRAVPETQDIPGSSGPSGPTTPPRRDRTSAQRSSKSRMKGSQANIPPSRRYSRSSPDDGNIGDASNSQDSSLSPSTNSSFLQKLKEVVPAEDLPENLLKKRRRHTVKDSNPFQADPYVDEGEITDSHEQSEDRLFIRSRSASQDISYFPHDSSEFDESSAYESTSIAEEPSSLPSTNQRQRSISPSEASSKPRTSRSRELRKRHSSQNSPLSSPTRPTLRRMRSATDQLRVYKQDDCVMARWERDNYYAGVVQGRQQERYQIHFLDDTRSAVPSEFIRPLKLKLGAKMLGMKADGGEYPAIIEGIHMAPEVDQSRVDVRFDDGAMGNLSLDKISLSQAMIDKLDDTIDWTKVEVRSAHPPKTTDTLEILPVQSSSASAPSTPRKNTARKQLSGRVSSGSLTPSRRGQVDAGLLSPSRRGKDLFKQLTFVLSLTGPGGSSELLTTTVRKITKEGGTVADDFPAVVENGVLRPNVILITVSAIRTNKYIEALAWNIPRLTYRWVDACVQHRQLLPYQSFLLPTGFSTELDTVISSTPLDDRGVFDGLTIGLYANQALLVVWSRILRAAGATVVTINSRAGDMGCNYIVFSSIDRHNKYCEKNAVVPPLATEWVTQCLINQRVLPIHGHPSYTTILPPVQKAT